MKILAIRLKNLASIEGEFEIDFTAGPLHSAGIFAISGATGAGKSTLLDALCLALYDRAPRFATGGENLMLRDVGDNQINQSDVKNILRRGTGEGYAEVDFRGVAGERHRSRWSVRRSRGKPTGSLRPQELKVVNLETETELQGTKTELLAQLVRLTGLTYEQFTRTVLLAQNDFATFLKSRESAKAELLEKLTGTEIYSAISREIYQRSKEADEELQHLREGLRLIEILPEEEITRLRQEQEAGKKTCAEIRSVLERWKEHLKDLRLLKEQTEIRALRKRNEAEEQERLQKIQGELQVHEEGMQRFREQCAALEPDLRKARELDARLGELKKNHTEAGRAWKEANTQKEEQEKQLAGKRQQTLQYVRSLTICREEGWLAKYEACRKEAAPQSEVMASLFDLPVAVEQVSDLTPLPEDAPVVQQLTQLEELCRRYQVLLAHLLQRNEQQMEQLNAFGIQQLGEEQTRWNRELHRLQEGRQRSLQWLRAEEEVKRITAGHTELQQRLAAVEKESGEAGRLLQTQVARLEAVQRIYDNARLSISENVQALRGNLRQEEPCPVCGSTAHPYRSGEQQVERMFGQIETEYKQAVEAHRQAQERVVAFRQDILNLGQQLRQTTVQLSERQEEARRLTPAREEERATDYYDRLLAEASAQLEQIAARLTAYQQLYEEWKRQDTEVKQLRAVCERLQQGISQCQLLVQQVETDRERLSLTVAHERTLKERLVRATEELEELAAQRAALLKGKTADEAEAAIRKHEAQLNELWESMKKDREQIRGRLLGLQGELRQIEVSVQELDRRCRGAGVPAALPEAIREQETLLSDTERVLSVTDARLLQQEHNRVRLRQAEVQLKEKEQTAEKWKKLNLLFGSADGRKFKIIAQSYTLNVLLLHANKHLSYLSRRYRLQQVPGTLALQVVDRDMCDEVRTVYSLSGGESFLISLALALGLSSLSSNNLKVESLFIDEGFGSLDADSLRTAMEALEQLQMQGRKIGVISHVQEMSERIAVQIQLHKAVNGKSRIKIK
ncbi:MAG: AAA family ATPase [Bacteroides sp.]|nr:AAA family ATPase [Bacteroides sp.]